MTPTAQLEINPDGATLLVVDGEETLWEHFDFTSSPRSWARRELSARGWRVVGWTRTEDGGYVTELA